MRRLILIVLAVCMLGTTAHADIPEAYGDEQEVWDCLEELCPTKEIAAGIMGFFFRESRLKSDAVAGWDSRAKETCEEFTKAVDNGMEKDEFIRQVQNFGGYGLGQWVSYDYVGELYDYVKTNGYSIADVRGQCEFTVWSIQQCDLLWSDLLQACTTALQCGRRIGIYYDGTTVDGAEAIAAFAQYYYERMRQ